MYENKPEVKGCTNMAVAAGKLLSGSGSVHRAYGERFCCMELETMRSSGVTDRVPLVIPEQLASRKGLRPDQWVKVEGQFRSYPYYEDCVRHVKLALFVRDMEIPDMKRQEDTVFLNGYVSRRPILRVTPRGIVIADLMVGVERNRYRTDYIPCVCWGRTAKYTACLAPGTRILLLGRIQSRDYCKILENGSEERTAYEVSVQWISEDTVRGRELLAECKDFTCLFSGERVEYDKMLRAVHVFDGRRTGRVPGLSRTGPGQARRARIKYGI